MPSFGKLNLEYLILNKLKVMLLSQLPYRNNFVPSSAIRLKGQWVIT